jgi:hypothetical protein
MTDLLKFDNLVARFHYRLETLPDPRSGKNISYSIKDAALGVFSVFFTQSPSFLAHQRAMATRKGRSNAGSLFQLEKIPCDNQIRSLLDPITPRHLYLLFDEILSALDQSGHLEPFRVL